MSCEVRVRGCFTSITIGRACDCRRVSRPILIGRVLSRIGLVGNKLRSVRLCLSGLLVCFGHDCVYREKMLDPGCWQARDIGRETPLICDPWPSCLFAVPHSGIEIVHCFLLFFFFFFFGRVVVALLPSPRGEMSHFTLACRFTRLSGYNMSRMRRVAISDPITC